MDSEEIELLEDLRLDLSRARTRLNMEADKLEEIELRIEKMRQRREAELQISLHNGV